MAVEVPKEQKLYATLLYWGSILGIVMLVATFAVYVMGVVPAYIEPSELPKLWEISIYEWEHVTGKEVPMGWEWISMLGYSDYLCYIGITFLAALTIICYMAIIPVLLAKKDMAFAAIAVIQVLVLLLAMSGVISAGH